MLQIRLRKGSAGDGGGASVKPHPLANTVTVACPDHLNIAGLPVAKSLGAVTSSAAVRTVGRRSRRNLGERVHFCLRCDFPIAMYGRLVPCEHAFCLTCARSDASCCLCDERIQKIQSIKMMEGIFICAAPNCLKSFLKQSDFESHIREAHADLQSNTKEGGTENEASASSIDTRKQSLLQETSIAGAPPLSGFSPSTNSQHHVCDERTRHQQSNDHPFSVVPLHLKPMPFNGPQQCQPGDIQADNNPPPNSWVNQPQSFLGQAGSQNRQFSDQLLSDQQGNALESSSSNYPPSQPSLLPNYRLPISSNQAIVPHAAFSYAHHSKEGSQQYFNVPYEITHTRQVPVGGPAEGSVLGPSPAPAGMPSFPGSAQRPWGSGQMIVPLNQHFMRGQGVPEQYINLTDSQGRTQSMQVDGPQISGGWLLNHSQVGQPSQLQGVSAVRSDSQGVLAQQIPLPPPQPLPLPMSQQLNAGKVSGFSSVNQ
ncbi:WD domain, G-beta repeat [Musa troglodytarum]|uniref:RING-type E3 ubiquitin transferase n=2 Tax=Musa troglodytarum TaxID=320322 RepID=A0A9E7E942_9LILI|nr:WD domain, G-beta repeat [Musa troglodytarum]